MKKIVIGITLSRVFEACQQWSQNRAFLRDNPNKSRDTLNFTYAMSEDDEAFFEEYSETVCSEIAIYDLFRLLRKNNTRCFTDDYDFDYSKDYCKFNYVVSNRFAVKPFYTLLYKLVQFKVLRYWYWEKNLYDEVQFIDLEIEKLNERLSSAVTQEAKASDMDDNNCEGGIDIVPYNDGFVINPPRRRKRLPALTDKAEEYGIKPIDPEPTPEPTVYWRFIKKLPNEIEINEQGNIHLSFSYGSNINKKEYKTIKEILRNTTKIITLKEYSNFKQLPIISEIEFPFADNEDDIYWVEVYVIDNNDKEEKVLQSDDCEVKDDNKGVYTKEYTKVYD